MKLAFMLILLVAVSGCGGASQASSTTLDPKGAVVRLADLPYGATPEPGRYWNNAQAGIRDNVSPGQYGSHGRVRSYTSSFYRSLVGGVPSGPIRADSEVSVYASPSDAHWGFLTLHRQLDRGYAVGAPGGGAAITSGAVTNTGYAHYPYTPVPTPRIGNEATSYTTTAPGDEFDYQTWIILFRHGRYIANVRVVGIDSMIPFKTAVAMANRVNARLKT